MIHRLISAGCVLAAAGAAFGGNPVPGVMINEIRIDQNSTDDSEYFELAGAAGTSLTGLTYLVIGDGAGGSGVIEAVIDLTGQSIPADGYFLCAETTFGTGSLPLMGMVDYSAGTLLNFENSDNVTHLLVAGFTGANGDDLDTDDDGVLDTMPWGSILDSIALITPTAPPTGDQFYAPSVGPDGAFVPGHVYRFQNFDGPWQIGAFAGGSDTPGVANIPAPGAAALVAMGGLLAARRRRS